MKIANSVTDLIGNTPLVRINRLAQGCAGEVLAKELRRQTGKTIELRSLNKEHEDRTFSADEVAGMDAIQQRYASTRNDIAIAMLFEVLADWQRRHGRPERSRLRVAVPTDLRGRADERMPAANRYTYIFLERALSECHGWESLLSGLQRDFQQRRHQQEEDDAGHLRGE